MQVGTELYVAVLVVAVTSTISIVGFIVMIVNDIRYHRQDVYRFDFLDKEAGGLNARHDRATTEHDGLSTQHDRLSAEHGRLSTEHDRLSTEHNNLKERLEKIYLNQEKDKAAREAAGKTMPEESKLVDLVSEIYEHHNQLMKRNIELENEVIQLKLQLNQYIQSKKAPTQESSWDLEDISGYGADRDDEEWER